MLVTNQENPNNPPKLANLPDSIFPIRLSDKRVIDIFTDYAIAKDDCDLCGFKISDDEELHLDHTHDHATDIANLESGLYKKKYYKSKSGVFRMFLHPMCNHAMGVLDAIIEKKSKPTPNDAADGTADGAADGAVDGAADGVTADENVTTVTYDPTTVRNQQFLQKLFETITLSATLQESWSAADLAGSIEAEQSLFRERKGFKPKYGEKAYKAWREENSGALPVWTKAEEDKLEEGLKRYEWGDWVMIAGKYVTSRFADECRAKARNQRFDKYNKYKNPDATNRED